MQIDILVTNCSIFCPTPSLSAMLINRFKMNSDIVRSISQTFALLSCICLDPLFRNEGPYVMLLTCCCSTAAAAAAAAAADWCGQGLDMRTYACVFLQISFHLGGMGCSAGLLSLALVQDLLQVSSCQRAAIVYRAKPSPGAARTSMLSCCPAGCCNVPTHLCPTLLCSSL